MARGSKSSYTSKQRRKAHKIEESAKKRHSPARAKQIAYATVNKQEGGGKKSGSGRGRAKRSTSKTTASRAGKKGGRKSARSKKRS